MFDELLDTVTDRNRSRHRANSSGGILGRLTQILGGEEVDDRHHDSRRPQDRDHRYDERDDDDRDFDDDRHNARKRRDFDLDFGD